MAQGLTEAGSEVTAGGITEYAHSLVAAPLTRVCPEEFSVGSSRQSSGRGQTWDRGWVVSDSPFQTYFTQQEQ